MSANNAIFIIANEHKVYYQPCMDNGLEGAIEIGKGESIDDCYKTAKNYIKQCEGDSDFPFMLEYGIQVI